MNVILYHLEIVTTSFQLYGRRYNIEYRCTEIKDLGSEFDWYFFSKHIEQEILVANNMFRMIFRYSKDLTLIETFNFFYNHIFCLNFRLFLIFNPQYMPMQQSRLLIQLRWIRHIYNPLGNSEKKSIIRVLLINRKMLDKDDSFP